MPAIENTLVEVVKKLETEEEMNSELKETSTESIQYKTQRGK